MKPVVLRAALAGGREGKKTRTAVGQTFKDHLMKEAMSDARPFVKWPGGKTRALEHLLPYFPKRFHTYYEPFIGGGALFFALANENRFVKASINDVLEELVITYAVVREKPKQLIVALKRIENRYRKAPEKTYYAEREKTRAADGDNVERSARMIFLNKTCFNGLYRVNQQGVFNASWGKCPDKDFIDRENIAACANALMHTRMSSGDFVFAAQQAKRGDVVYFDPPFMPVHAEADSFTSYSRDGFSETSHTTLAGHARELVARGVRVILSNVDTEQVRRLYRGDFELHPVNIRRSISTKGSERHSQRELIIVGRQ